MFPWHQTLYDNSSGVAFAAPDGNPQGVAFAAPGGNPQGVVFVAPDGNPQGVAKMAPDDKSTNLGGIDMAKTAITGRVHSVESFGSVDGPGVRFIFFLQGCPMRCQYCHNPDTWRMQGGELYTPEEAFAKAYRYRSYWKGGGGITVSGGEALLQMDFVLELFRIAKAHGVHTALDTSGILFTKKGTWFDKFQELMAVTDLFILDIKEIRSDAHKALTGHGNEPILEMAQYLSDRGKEMWIRHVLVPGITDSEEDLKGLGDFIRSLKTVSRTEILPYHSLGMPKYQKMGIPYPLEGVPSPTGEQVHRAEKLLGIPKHS